MFPYAISAIPMGIKQNTIKNEMQTISEMLNSSNLNYQKVEVAKSKNELIFRG